MLKTLVNKIQSHPFAAARNYQKDGGRVIGFVGSEIPVELIIAGEAMPLRLPELVIKDLKHADHYFEDSFAPAARAIAELYLEGRLDFLETIIFSRSNDNAQRLYYYLCEIRQRNLTNGPEPLIYDLAKIPRSSSLAHSRQATRKLAHAIGTDEIKLPEAIAIRNRRRKLLALALAQLGQNNVQGSFMDRVFRSADLCHADQFDMALSDWLHQNQGKNTVSGPRMLLAGSTPPDERLHQAVEKGGGNVVAELGDFASCAAVLPPVDEKGSFDDLTAHYQSLPHGPRAFVNRAEMTLSLAKSARVDGVILWLIEQEEAIIWDLPSQNKALTIAGIPVLSMARRLWDASDGAIDEITAFTGSLGGRS